MSLTTDNEKPVFVGLDLGFGQVKAAASNGKEICFPSYTARIEDLSMLPNDMRRRAIKEGQHYWLAGQDAFSMRKVRDTHIDSRRIQTDDFRILGLHALNMLKIKKAEIVTGLPIKDFSEDKSTIKRIIQSWDQYGYQVKVQHVIPQPIGTLANVSRRNGKEDKRFFTGKVAIIDVGNGTTDLIEVNDGSVSPTSYSSDSFAVSIAQKLVRNNILIKHKADYDISEIPRIMETGTIELNGKPQKVENIIRDAKRQVVINAIAQAKRLWGDINRFKFVIVTGGGAELLKDEFKALIPEAQLIIPDSPAMANARGYLSLCKTRA